MEKILRGKIYNDFSKGNYQSVSENLAPENSVKLGLNLDSDDTLGWLVSRKGSTLVNAQIVDNKPVLGLYNFRDSVGSGSKLFAVVSDGTNSDIYDAESGAKSLQDDTKDLKTRFLTYLDSCLRLNGTDEPKAWTGAAWVTTAGAFDLDNLPQTSKYAVEFRDRVYVAGSTTNPDRVDYSGIASSTARTVSWTVGNGFIVFEQEDGGGGITGLSKVPGYLLVFKKRTLKRFDGSSAYPEDMTNQGAPSQEAIAVAKGTCFWVNENGVWATTGGEPKKISSFSVDKVVKSCSSANLLNVASGTDEEHVFWSFASVTMSGETYTNVVLKYNLSQNTWDIRKYPTLHRVYAKFVDTSNNVFLACGDDDGNVLKMDTGNDDNGTPIYWAFESQDWFFGFRLFLKSITRIGFVTENISKAIAMWRNTNKPEDWKPLGVIDREEVLIEDDLRGTKFNIKICNSTDSGQEIIKSVEFPEGIKVFSSVK
jgi:hypothetical protein